MTASGEESVSVTLSGDEALVLYDWLARTEETDGPAPFVDQAELRVLWQLQGAIERSLVAAVRGDGDDEGDDAIDGAR